MYFLDIDELKSPRYLLMKLMLRYFFTIYHPYKILVPDFVHQSV